MEELKIFATIMAIGITLGLGLAITALVIQLRKDKSFKNLTKAAKGATQHTN